MEYLALLLMLLQVHLDLCKVDERCVDYANKINYHHATENYDIPNPLGKWVSSRCEIIPDKQFVYRRFDILSLHFNGFIYHYSDSWCTKPTFIVKITGTYEILPATATTNSKAASAAKFNFDKVYIRTKSASTLETILNYIETHCAKALGNIQSMIDGTKINLDKYINQDIQINSAELKKRCRYFFGVHPVSYKKIRIVEDKTKRVASKYDILYFADIPPISVRTRDHKFAEFQYGLSRRNRPNCPVCALSAEQADKHPILPVSSNRVFTGQWVSKTCEMSDATTYVTRFYEILPKVSGKDYGVVYMYSNYFDGENCETKKNADDKRWYLS